MKNQRLKILTLTVLLGIAGSACNRQQNSNDAQQGAQEEQVASDRARVEAEQKAERQRQIEEDRAREEYREHVSDSIARANGVPEGTRAFWADFEKVNDSIRNLEYKNGVTYALQNAVNVAGNRIADEYVNVLEGKLRIYNLPFDRELVKKQLANSEFIMWGAYADANSEYDNGDWALDDAVEEIVRSLHFENTDYGTARKQEVTQMIRRVIVEMCGKMRTSRKNIERQYAPYIVGGMETINNSVLSYCEGDAWAEYNRFLMECKYMVTKKTIWLYDSQLPVDFFTDADAEYSIEKKGEGRWCIVKKTKDGQISRTKTFTHNTDYTISTEYCDDVPAPRQGDKKFSAEPGANLGVHISYTEIISVKTAEREFRGSPELERQINELRQLRQQLETRSEDVWRVERYADSIARQMAQQWQPNKVH
ncbi:MAG: hypothetical protein J5613_02570 [Alphaproteobacteria bacterium]|nr:hypothetical protein [Alphaproteobacteria bacterium]